MRLLNQRLPVIPTKAQRSGEIFSDHLTSFKDFSASLEMTMDLDHYAEYWFLAFTSAKARTMRLFNQRLPGRHPDRSAAQWRDLFRSFHSAQRFLCSINNKIIDEPFYPAIKFLVLKPAKANYSECYKKVKISLGKN